MEITSTDKDCIKIAAKAYSSQTELKKSFISGFTQPDCYSSSADAQGIATDCNNSKRCYIAFRGSDSVQDWMINIDITRACMPLEGVAEENCPKVHAGFLKQFQSLQSDVEKRVESCIRRNGKNCEICFTGHSLGGSVACLAALHCGVKYPDCNIKCCAYGPLRVGGDKFKQLCGECVDDFKCIVDEDDPICNLPYGFGQLPNSYCITADYKLKRLPKDSFWDSLGCCACLAPFVWDEHDVSAYLDKISMF